MKLQSKIYFICDICGVEEIPDFELQKKISDDNLKEKELPYHCSQSMRLSVLEKPVDDTRSSQINTKSVQWSLIEVVKLYFDRKTGSQEIGEKFEEAYLSLLNEEDHEFPEIMIHKMERAIAPAIDDSIYDNTDKEIIKNIVKGIIDNAISNAKQRMKAHSPINRLGQILPGNYGKPSLELVCAVCDENIEVSPEFRNQLLESDEELELPQHHNQPVMMKIMTATKPKVELKESSTNKYDFFSTSQVEEMQITSVGIDIGSSTSHLIFSKIDLRREVGFLNMTNRFNVVKREITYQSKIINTPFLDTNTIDLESLIQFILNEYAQARIHPDQVDTGAVIITGETAKKENAAEIVSRISDTAGKFVSATAGPNLESKLSAIGSGASQRSLENQSTILNVDVGGGTSNLAIIVNGKVVDTSCINVGGRLLGIDADRKIWRIDQPTQTVMTHLDIQYDIGDTISVEHLEMIVQAYASVLFEVMRGPAESKLAKSLMMTKDIDYNKFRINEIIFSGGVAEMIYGGKGNFNDIGSYLAGQIKLHTFAIPVIEPPNKIRATVIGAGSHSLAISGSTISYDTNIKFPLLNVPVLLINVTKENFNSYNVIREIQKSFTNHDLSEGDEVVALYFVDPIYARDMFLNEFVLAIEKALPKTISNDQMIILVFNSDVGGTIGRAMKKLTKINKNFICIDEIELREGDWIDIGEPLHNKDVFPITIKSLIFN